MSKIINAKIYNFMGISEVEITPDGKSLIIGGANGQGKSSLIKALMAVGGKRLVPERPVKDGADKAEIEISIDTPNGMFVAAFETTADRNTKLVVRSEDGKKISTPQTFLDSLFSGVSFDPGAFKSQKPSEQRDTLLKLVGLDLSGLDTKRAQVYAERTDVSRSLKRAEAQLAGMPHIEGAEVALSLSSIVTKLEIIKRQADGRRETQGLIDQAIAKQSQISTEIEVLSEKLAALKQLYTDVTHDLNEYYERMTILPKPTKAEYDALKSQLEGAEQHNKNVALNEQRKEKVNEVSILSESLQQLEAEILRIDNAKQEAINSATFPVEGLGFDDSGVTFNGRPLSQASEAEQWKVSLAIGFALNPHGVLFMPTTGGLDRANREKIIKQAEELGVQLILEVVDVPDDVTLVVEAGRVKE